VTREELEHAIRAACEIAEDAEVWVFGSQAILGQFPEAPAELRQSAEADIAPKNFPNRADRIDAVLGELSTFHQTHGFYVHGLSLEAATLPSGWQGRARRVQNENTRGYTGLCVEAHDLAASKLKAFREKDRSFVRVLLGAGLIKANRLVRVINLLPVSVEERRRLTEWVDLTTTDLSS
jgi:hypothetical protein